MNGDPIGYVNGLLYIALRIDGNAERVNGNVQLVSVGTVLGRYVVGW